MSSKSTIPIILIIGKQEQMKKAQCSKNYARKFNFRNVAALAILFGQVSTFLKDSTTFVYGRGEILVKTLNSRPPTP